MFWRENEKTLNYSRVARAKRPFKVLAGKLKNAQLFAALLLLRFAPSAVRFQPLPVVVVLDTATATEDTTQEAAAEQTAANSQHTR